LELLEHSENEKIKKEFSQQRVWLKLGGRNDPNIVKKKNRVWLKLNMHKHSCLTSQRNLKSVFLHNNYKNPQSQVPVAPACNPIYSGGRDQEDGSSEPAWVTSSWEPISKIPNTKGAGGVAQDMGPKFKPQYRKKPKQTTKKPWISTFVTLKWGWKEHTTIVSIFSEKTEFKNLQVTTKRVWVTSIN
jgi:hypothetical protein